MPSFFSRLVSPLKRIPVPARVRTFAAGIVPRSFVLGLAATLVIGGGYMVFGRGSTQAQTSTSLAQASRQTIVSSVKAVGKVTFASEQQLKFNQRGTVTKVNVKEGDTVKKGDLIAELDTTTVLADIRQAELSVNASALQLKQLQSEKSKTVLDAQNAVSDAQRQYQEAQNDLSVAQDKLPSDLAAAERAVTEKQDALKQATNELAKARTTEMQSLGTTAQSVLSESEDLVDTLYGILVNDSSARHSDSDHNIEVYYRLYNDMSQKDTVVKSYNTALQAIADMRATYGGNLSSLTDGTKLSQALTNAKAVATAVHGLADNTYSLLLGATTDPHDFTVSDINGLKQTAINARTSAANLSDDAKTALANLTSDSSGITSIAIKQKQDAVQSAQHSLDAAKENLNVLQTKTPADMQKQLGTVTNMQEGLDSQQASYQNTLSSTDIQISLKQNDVSQKAASLQKTRKALDDYRLIAPFDGVVRHIDYKVGDNLLADTSEEKVVTLENPDFLLITILLDQVDVVRVKKEMAAKITLDALPGQTFTGSIATINPTPVEQSGVVSYEVEVKLPTPKELTILSGMTTTVDIETTRKENVLTVPNLALKRDATGKTTVQKANGQTVAVEVGATNGKVTEILSGLQDGDSVVAVNVTTTATASSANAGQILRLGGGGGGGNFGGTTRPAGR